MTGVDKSELIMTMGGGIIWALTVYTAYRLSTRNSKRLRPVINWILLLFLFQSVVLLIALWLSTHFPKANDFWALAVDSYAWVVLFGLYVHLPLALFMNALWYAMHYKALSRIRAMHIAKRIQAP